MITLQATFMQLNRAPRPPAQPRRPARALGCVARRAGPGPGQRWRLGQAFCSTYHPRGPRAQRRRTPAPYMALLALWPRLLLSAGRHRIDASAVRSARPLCDVHPSNFSTGRDNHPPCMRVRLWEHTGGSIGMQVRQHGGGLPGGPQPGKRQAKAQGRRALWVKTCIPALSACMGGLNPLIGSLFMCICSTRPHSAIAKRQGAVVSGDPSCCLGPFIAASR